MWLCAVFVYREARGRQSQSDASSQESFSRPWQIVQKIPTHQQKRRNGGGILYVEKQTIDWGKNICKVENAGQVFSRETWKLRLRSRSQGRVPLKWPNVYMHLTPFTTSAFIFSHSKTHRCLHMWITKAGHRKSSETRQNVLKTWQEVDSTKWRFKWFDLEKVKKGNDNTWEERKKIAWIKF